MAQQKKDDMTMETEICHNCKREVPQQNYLMHVVHCARNMAVCPVCGDAVPKAHLKEHRQKEHALVECPACRNKVQVGAMENHRATSCGRRTMACEYCELELPKDDLNEHISYCGARTERCDECGELVMHKYQKLHLDSNHGFLKLNDEPGPTPSWEASAAQPNRSKQNSIKKSKNDALNSLQSINNALPTSSRRSTTSTTTTTTSTTTNHNVDTVEATVPLKSKKLDEENGFLPSAEPPPRDAPRTFVPAYDASEDLRAKVKLARHDLNNIKNTYLLQGEERVRHLQQQSRQVQRGPELMATNKTPRTRFTTNLVPYEKNKSVKVNALPDDERAIVMGAIPQPLPIFGGDQTSTQGGSGYFNYLGAREEPAVPVLPLSTKLINGPSSNKKIVTGIATQIITASPSTNKINSENINNNGHGHGHGAVPRPSRKKGPAPPIPNSPIKQKTPTTPLMFSTPSDHDEVSLPCEFCDKLISASCLVQHETACRPDLAQLRVPRSVTLMEDSTDVAASAAPVITPPTSPEVQLPCEFCCNLYPASKLLSHQALCDV